MTSQQVAEAIGVHRTTLYRWEDGRVPVPDWAKARLAHMYRVGVPDLFDFGPVPVHS